MGYPVNVRVAASRRSIHFAQSSERRGWIIITAVERELATRGTT